MALFLNRILYAIYEVDCITNKLVYRLIACTFGRFLYGIPFIRRKMDYKSLCNKTEIPKSAFKYNKLSLFIFALPIFLVFNVVTIVVGSPINLLYTKSPIFIVLLISITFLISFLLDNYFFWNEDRYLTFFPAFKKEHLIKRLVWIVGTFVALVLLSMMNIKAFCYIINASK